MYERGRSAPLLWIQVTSVARGGDLQDVHEHARGVAQSDKGTMKTRFTWKIAKRDMKRSAGTEVVTPRETSLCS